MKKNLSLSITTPCSAKWGSFTPAANGGFCSSCSKVVVDFTRMGDDEILNFFTTKQASTCGRFRADQLKSYSVPVPLKVNPGMALLKAGFVSLLLVVVSKPASAQRVSDKAAIEVVQHPGHEVAESFVPGREQLIKGIVKSGDDGSVLPGVTIYLKGAEEGTVTNTEGRFEFPRKLNEGDVLVFSFIGLETKEYAIPNKANEEIEITMVMSDVMMMGAVAVDDVYTTKQSFIRRWWTSVKGLF